MRLFASVFILGSVLGSAAWGQQSSAPSASPFQPAVFAPGVISTGDSETTLELSPDGKTAYFLRNAPNFAFWTIYESHLKNGQWSRPEIAPFSGRYMDADPFITADGKQLFFISNRPVDPKAEQPNDNFDIWVMDRGPQGEWSQPRHLEAPVNSPASEYYPRASADGTLYFGSERPGGLGQADLWRCRFQDGHYQPAENLGPAINSAAEEYEPYVTPKGDMLIFMAVGRDGKQQSDFFISFLRDGAWTPAKLLGPPISLPTGKEYAPKLSPDGKLFLFSSTRSDWKPGLSRRLNTREYEERLHSPGNGLGDIYTLDARALPTGP